MSANLKSSVQMDVDDENATDADKPSMEATYHTTVADDPTFVRRLSKECCSECRPHPSYYQDTGVVIPTVWHHMPWDEMEMKKHELVDTQCQHLQAAAPLDEIRVRGVSFPGRPLRWSCPGSAANATTAGSGKKLEIFEVQEFSSSEETEEDQEESSESWRGIGLSPLFPYGIDLDDPVEGKIAVKQLPGEGRLLVVNGEAGCTVRILQNAAGESLLVRTRCNAQKTDQSNGPESAHSGAQSSTEPHLITDAFKPPPLKLMSHLHPRKSGKIQPVSPPSTWSPSTGESPRNEPAPAPVDDTERPVVVRGNLSVKPVTNKSQNGKGPRQVEMKLSMNVNVGKEISKKKK